MYRRTRSVTLRNGGTAPVRRRDSARAPLASARPIGCAGAIRLSARLRELLLMTPNQIRAWRPGRYLRSSGAVFSWMLLRAIAQAALVVVMSRLLGAAGYGQFVAVIAVASFFSALAGLGLGGVVLRDGARQPSSLDARVQHSLRVWTWSTIVSAPVALAVALLTLPRGLSFGAVAFTVIAEIASSSLTDLLARSEQARHRLGHYGAITAGLPLVRLVMLAAYLLLTEPSLRGWLYVYATASLAYAAGLLACLTPRSPGTSEHRSRLRDGLPFLINTLAMRLQAEFNKPVLARGGFALAGTYSAAQRTVDIASLPLAALQEALWPRLYAEPDPRRGLWALGGYLVAVAILGGSALWFASGWLPRMLGPDFGPSVQTLKLLAWLPAVQVLRSLINFNVIHKGRTSLIGWAAAFGAVSSIALVASLVPHWGSLGAVAASYATEVVMIMTLLCGLAWHARLRPPSVSERAP